MQANEKQTNTPVPVSRTLYAGDKGTIMQLPGQDELVIVKKSKPRDPNYRLSMPTGDDYRRNTLGHAGLYDTTLAYQSQRSVLMQASPVIGFQIQSWNYAAVQRQYNMYKTNRAAYDALTARLIWYGADYGDTMLNTDLHQPNPDLGKIVGDAPDPEGVYSWCGFSLDGIALIEETADGRSSYAADGYDRTSSTLGRDRPLGPATPAAKVYTVTASGQQNMIDICEGRGLCEGARIHLVLKRFPLDNVELEQQQFVLAHKSGPLGLPVQGATETLPCPTVPATATHRTNLGVDVNLVEKGFRPFMLAAVSTPDGRLLDPEYLE
jgi:hypothetical protein